MTALHSTRTAAWDWLRRARFKAGYKLRHRRRQFAGWLARSRTALLAVAGFGFLSSAAWDALGRGAGLACIGGSLLVLEALSGRAP